MAQQTPPNTVGTFQDTVQVANVPALLTAATTTNVFTVPASKRFILTKVVVHDPNGNASGATLNVGSANTTANSLNAAQALTALGTSAGSTMAMFLPSATSAPVLQGGDVVTVAPGTAATGVTVQIDLIGYLM